MLLVSLAFNCL